MEERRAVHGILVGKRKVCCHLEDLGVDVRITLTFQSLAVSLCATRFNTQKFYMVLT